MAGIRLQGKVIKVREGRDVEEIEKKYNRKEGRR
jgi:hypothetical protein